MHNAVDKLRGELDGHPPRTLGRHGGRLDRSRGDPGRGSPGRRYFHWVETPKPAAMKPKPTTMFQFRIDSIGMVPSVT
ncbi:hypothetical protein GCM10010497_39140 [Streptomyces cinereoruber]|uniref:Uncharacterized protein n=1 Tax=Streptomyces cinereoruber TaxID=67260 RepID=A0AAV4KMP6_9ACTN|nr:hypothetical protein GCM10010497_39140 [Streptomyces cinereoruber]